MAPAAVTESPSPMTTDELLSGMVTEEVEPGVLRVVNDGVRDLSYPDSGYPGPWVDITPDGSVWLSGADGAMYRLGDEATFEAPRTTSWSPYLDVAPDGSLWAIAGLGRHLSRSMARGGRNGRPRPATTSCYGRWPSAPTARSGWRRVTGTSTAPTSRMPTAPAPTSSGSRTTAP